jgi:ferredoxin-NADP reductase
MSIGTAERTRSAVETRVVLREKTEIAPGIVRLVLAPLAETELPDWTPGSHIDLVLPNGEVRQYSLLPPSSAQQWRVAVLREKNGRGGSRYVHDDLQPGDELVARGPRNNFPVVASPRYVFLAGGIGITPLLSMIEHVDAAGSDWTLVYCGRSRATMALTDVVERYGAGRVTLHHDDEAGLFDLAAHLAEPVTGTVVYACGPRPFLDAVSGATAHWPAGALHVEHFSSVEQADTEPTRAFEVELRSSGRTVAVPAGVSILEAVREAGVQVLSSCAEGTCGTCETVVLDGEVDHRDSVLSREEQESSETMMICVSRARCPRLALEL